MQLSCFLMISHHALTSVSHCIHWRICHPTTKVDLAHHVKNETVWPAERCHGNLRKPIRSKALPSFLLQTFHGVFQWISWERNRNIAVCSAQPNKWWLRFTLITLFQIEQICPKKIFKKIMKFPKNFSARGLLNMIFHFTQLQRVLDVASIWTLCTKCRASTTETIGRCQDETSIVLRSRSVPTFRHQMTSWRALRSTQLACVPASFSIPQYLLQTLDVCIPSLDAMSLSLSLLWKNLMV